MKTIFFSFLLLLLVVVCDAHGFLCCTEEYIRSSFKQGEVTRQYKNGVSALIQDDAYQWMMFIIDPQTEKCIMSTLTPKKKELLDFLTENFNRKAEVVKYNSEWRLNDGVCATTVLLSYDPELGNYFSFFLTK